MSNVNRKLLDSLYPVWKRYNNFRAKSLKYPQSKGEFNSIPPKKMIEYNRERFWGAKELFCYNAFGSMFFDIFGNVVACCRSHENVLGTYPNNSISEIWNGEGYEKLRKHLLHNDLSNGCHYCEFQINSNRFRALPSIHIEDVVNAKKLGKYPVVMEFELANTCNLQCVMCSGRVSSSIRQHREKLPPLKSPYDYNFVEQLKEFIPHLNHAYFFGGEPFLVDIYYKIWDEIIRLNPKIKLSAVTNGTVMSDRVKQIISKTNFNIIVSLDSLNKERNEAIRVGSNIDKVLENIKIFDELTGNKIFISHTPMVLNWRDTPEIIKYCIENNYRINLSYIERPLKYALWAQMPEFLDEVYSYYQSVDWSTHQKGFNAKNNYKIFNEWMLQVAFFRDKNRELLDFYQPKLSKEQLAGDILEKLDLAYNYFNIDTARGEALKKYFIEIVEKLETHPWHISSLESLYKSISNLEELPADTFLSFIENPDLLQESFIQNSQFEFFEQYYF